MDRKAFYTLLMAMFVTSLGVGFITPLLPTYAESLGADGLWIGLIFGANPLVRGAFTLFVGSLADRREKRGLMLTGLMGYVFCSLAFLASRAPYQLFLARVAQGAFSAMVMPVSRAYAGSLAPRGKEGSVMGQLSLAFSLGFAIGPLMGGVLNDLFGLAAPFIGMSTISLLAWFFVWRFVPQSPPKPGFVAKRGLDFRPFGDRQVVGLIAGRGLVEVGRGIFSTLMPLIGADQIGLSSSLTGVIVTLRSTMESVVQPISGRLADRINRRTICMAGFLLMPIALLLTPNARSFYALGSAAVLLGMAAGIAVPAAAAIAVDKGRIYGMGSLMGLDSTAQALGMALGSTVGGTIYELFSTNAAFRSAAAAALVGAAVFGTFTRGYHNEGAKVETVAVASGSERPLVPAAVASADGQAHAERG